MSPEEKSLEIRERRIREEREYIDQKKAITSMLCPICGSPLRGYVAGPSGNESLIFPHIVCRSGCGMFHAEGEPSSLYKKGMSKATALIILTSSVRPWIKRFASPLTEDY